MQLNSLTAISPLDGRYFHHTKPLAPYFSEFGLIRYRVLVEIEYFIALCEHPLPELKNAVVSFETLRAIYRNFDEQAANRIKEIERTTNHDVKAVEYYLKEQFDSLGLGNFKEFIHFGLTSQDINNTATPLLLKEAIDKVLLPQIHELVALLDQQVHAWKDVAMLARTHGQPASPTRLGKEIQVFSTRIKNQLTLLPIRT